MTFPPWCWFVWFTFRFFVSSFCLYFMFWILQSTLNEQLKMENLTAYGYCWRRVLIRIARPLVNNSRGAISPLYIVQYYHDAAWLTTIWTFRLCRLSKFDQICDLVKFHKTWELHAVPVLRKRLMRELHRGIRELRRGPIRELHRGPWKMFTFAYFSFIFYF